MRPRTARRDDGQPRRSGHGNSRRACSPRNVWLVASGISTCTRSPGGARPPKLTTLLWRVRPRRRSGRCARRPRPAPPSCARRTAARARAPAAGRPRRAAASARPSTSCGTSVLEPGRLRAAPRREDEGEGAVVADLLHDLERLAEVGLGLAREADDDVRGQRDVRHVLADQRHAVEVSLARVGAPHGFEDPRASRPAAAGGCARTRTEAPRGRG